MSDMLPATEIISAMITPAILILGSGSLVSTAMVRLGRVVDRARTLNPVDGPEKEITPKLRHWLDVYRHRATLIERSVTCFFVAVSCFVLDGLCIAVDRLSKGTVWWLPVSITIIGMGVMLAGAFLMVQECRLATRQAHEEIG